MCRKKERGRGNRSRGGENLRTILAIKVSIPRVRRGAFTLETDGRQRQILFRKKISGVRLKDGGGGEKGSLFSQRREGRHVRRWRGKRDGNPSLIKRRFLSRAMEFHLGKKDSRNVNVQDERDVLHPKN